MAFLQIGGQPAGFDDGGKTELAVGIQQLDLPDLPQVQPHRVLGQLEGYRRVMDIKGFVNEGFAVVFRRHRHRLINIRFQIRLKGTLDVRIRRQRDIEFLPFCFGFGLQLNSVLFRLGHNHQCSILRRSI